jgi:GWxTD domain-containing protein
MPPERRWAAAILWMAFAALVFAPHGARGQVEASGVQTDPRDEHFYLDAVSFADQAGGSRLDVFVQVGYELLTFIKNDQVYDASYEVTVSMYDSLKTLITEKSWVEEVKGVTFDQSVSPNLYSLTQRVFSVTPGGYEVAASVRDNETKTLRRRVRRLLVSEYRTPPLALSDIMIVSRVTERAGKKAMVPNVSGNVGGIPEAFFAYLEAYNRLQVDSLKFVTSVIGEKGENKLEVDTVVAMKPGRNDFLFRIPHASLTLGDYRLLVRAYSRDSLSHDPDAYLATTDRPLLVRWQYFPVGVKSLDLAISQVRYIARDNEFDVLEEAKTEEEKQARLLEFWKRRDPNPNTDRNERMEEYYRRADYANKNFAHHREGWRTDMGMVYMMFGPPNDVSRHPFELDSKPYEVWRYYDISYDFVFVDDTGFADYRLITPIWEAWQRVK